MFTINCCQVNLRKTIKITLCRWQVTHKQTGTTAALIAPHWRNKTQPQPIPISTTTSPYSTELKKQIAHHRFYTLTSQCTNRPSYFPIVLQTNLFIRTKQNFIVFPTNLFIRKKLRYCTISTISKRLSKDSVWILVAFFNDHR